MSRAERRRRRGPPPVAEPTLEVIVVRGPISSSGTVYPTGGKLRMTLTEAENFGDAVEYDIELFYSLHREWLRAIRFPEAAVKPEPERVQWLHTDEPAEMFRASPPRARIGWYHDTPGELGGAEASNAELIRWGRALGYDIEHVHRENWGTARHRNNLAVVCNVRLYSDEQRRQLDRVLFERMTPYLWRDHDYQFCKARGNCACHSGGPCDPHCTADAWQVEKEAYRRLTNGARLRVFISPRQLEINGHAFGYIGKSYLLPPPVNVDTFRPVPGIEREPYLAVCTVGRLDVRKGRDNVTRWAAENPDWRVEVYVRGGPTGALAGVDGLPHGRNVAVVDAVPLADVPAVYSRAEACLFLPSIPEPAGRTPIEAALCGCRPITNENWSAGAFNLTLDDPAILREEIRAGIAGFWRAVEEVLCSI